MQYHQHLNMYNIKNLSLPELFQLTHCKVTIKNRAGNSGEARSHDLMDFGIGQMGQERFDQQDIFRLTQERLAIKK